ncbi:odorant receptor 4-like isoform X1 [Frankliniella occidentalis]|uniref:Odorant receptor n=1 Tax=Frankliniella occidentalis TaxID=133901 RepID=A0A9C6U3G7_FRAOC|nr:odorant receptor 4-like isoform X1 [Frankliniella occidentalis]
MFAFNYILLALSGIWPPEGLPPALLGVYVVLSTVAHAFFFYSCGAYTVGFLNCDDVDLAMGAACDVLVVYLTCYKIFVLLKNKRVINGLVYSLRHELNVSYAPLQRACRDHEEAVNNLASKVTGRYYLVLLSVDATYIFMYFRAELRGQVRIPMWDPFGARVSTGLPFLLYSCVPVSAALMSGIHTTVFDTMILTFSLLLGAKIDNLTRLLVTLEEDTGPRPAAEVRAERQRRLREAVIIHQKIIRFVDNLERALSSLSLAQLMESLATICLQGYRLTAAPPSMDEGIPMINFLLWLLLQLWILCWSGENIATKSKHLAVVAARSHWADAGHAFHVNMQMLMLRAQRPLALTGFKMVRLNYSTYVDIVKNSYSLYTCMLRMQSKNRSEKPNRSPEMSELP